MANFVYFITLVLLLGSPNFRTREAANFQLELAGLQALPYVSFGIKSKDPEVITRCIRLRKSIKNIEYRQFNLYTSRILESLENGKSPNSDTLADRLLCEFKEIPWMDAFPYQYECRSAIIEKTMSVVLRSGLVTEAKPGDFTSFRVGTRFFVSAMFDVGISEKVIRKIVKHMENICKVWNGHGPPPYLEDCDD